MDKVWELAAQQVPSLAVLCLLVVLFLKHIKESDDRWREAQEAMVEALKDLKSSCHDFCKDLSDESKVALSKSDVVLERTTEVLGKALFIIENRKVS